MLRPGLSIDHDGGPGGASALGRRRPGRYGRVLYRRIILKYMEEDFTLVYEAGTLEVDPVDGRVRCHLCGCYFVSLGSHVYHKHKLLADDYRDLVSLNRGTALISAEFTERLRVTNIPRFERLQAEGKVLTFGKDPVLLARALALSSAVMHERGHTIEGRRNVQEAISRDRGVANCVRCGEPFQLFHHLARYCAICRPTHEKELHAAGKRRRRALDQQGNIPCARCGARFTRQCNTKWCPECRSEIEAERCLEKLRRQRVYGPDSLPPPPRHLACARCGQEFIAQGNAKYCLPCRPLAYNESEQKFKERKRQRACGVEPTRSSPGAIPCDRCGQTFESMSPTAKYCSPCNVEVCRQRQRESRLRRRGIDPATAGPRQIMCVRCGQNFAHPHGSAKYCPPCRPVVAAEQHQASRLRLRQADGFTGRRKRDPSG